MEIKCLRHIPDDFLMSAFGRWWYTNLVHLLPRFESLGQPCTGVFVSRCALWQNMHLFFGIVNWKWLLTSPPSLSLVGCCLLFCCLAMTARRDFMQILVLFGSLAANCTTPWHYYCSSIWYGRHNNHQNAATLVAYPFQWYYHRGWYYYNMVTIFVFDIICLYY